MKVDLTKKEIAAIGELIYAVTDDRARLAYPHDPFGSIGDATPNGKGERLFRSAWAKLSDAADLTVLEWDDLFVTAECEKCGK